MPGRSVVCGIALCCRRCIGCGGQLHIQDGAISSPGYPHTYGSSIECVWFITARPSYHVNIVFNEPFGIENSPGCSNDYLQASLPYDTIQEVTRIPRF